MVFSKKTFVFRSIYLLIGFIGLFLATEITTGKFNQGFFVYYTNLSNLIAFGLTPQSRSLLPL